MVDGLAEKVHDPHGDEPPHATGFAVTFVEPDCVGLLIDVPVIVPVPGAVGV